MASRNRTTLKSFFRNGSLPTSEHFADLIDSNVNQAEDGFEKTPQDGLKLNSIGSELRVMSLYKGLDAQSPAWTVDHGADDTGALHFRPASETGPHAAEALTIAPNGRIGVGTGNPQHSLDVAGPIRMSGRIGGYLFEDMETGPLPARDDLQPNEVPANGRWHDISPVLTGCQAFEVMAGAGGAVGDGRYALVHAVALNAFHPRNWLLDRIFGRRRIRHQTAVYGSYADRIRLRWDWHRDRNNPYSYRLQIRTHANFGKGMKIQFFITRLWFDPLMNGTRPADAPGSHG